MRIYGYLVLWLIPQLLSAQHFPAWVLGDGNAITFEPTGVKIGVSEHALLQVVYWNYTDFGPKLAPGDFNVCSVNAFDENGVLLFYYDGLHLRNANHDTIAGGDDLIGKMNYKWTKCHLLNAKQKDFFYLIQYNQTPDYVEIFYSVIQANASNVSIIKSNIPLGNIPLSKSAPHFLIPQTGPAAWLVYLRDSLLQDQIFMERIMINEDPIASTLTLTKLTSQKIRNLAEPFRLDRSGNTSVISFNNDLSLAVMSHVSRKDHSTSTNFYHRLVLYHLNENLEILYDTLIDTCLLQSFGSLSDLFIMLKTYDVFFTRPLNKTIFSANGSYLYYLDLGSYSRSYPMLCRYELATGKIVRLPTDITFARNDRHVPMAAMDMKYGFDGHIYIAHGEYRDGSIKLSRILNPDGPLENLAFEWLSISLPSDDTLPKLMYTLPISNFTPVFPVYKLSRQNDCSDTLIIHNLNGTNFIKHQLWVNGKDTLIEGNPSEIKLAIADTGWIRFAGYGYMANQTPTVYYDSLYWGMNKGVLSVNPQHVKAAVKWDGENVLFQCSKVVNATHYIWQESTGAILYEGTDTFYYYKPKNIEKLRESLLYHLYVKDTCGNLTKASLVTLLYPNIIALEEAGYIHWDKYQKWPNGIKEYQLSKQTESGQFDPQYSGLDTFFIDLEMRRGLLDKACYQVKSIYADGWWSSSLINCYIFEKQVWIPNAFTPNQDGLNDTFKPIVSGIIDSSYSLTIYNRWGQQLYYTTDRTKGWDGTFANNRVEAGVYFYLLRCKSLKPSDGVMLYRGTLLLTD